jgi:hypothetical protein
VLRRRRAADVAAGVTLTSENQNVPTGLED